MSSTPQIKIRKKRVGPLLGRHPWLFSGALINTPEGLAHGEPVQICSESGEYLASGYFNSYSQIAVRIWSFDKNEKVDDAFFYNRIETALRLRTSYIEYSGTNGYRLINSENDLLPGLIVDRYGDYLSLQFHTRGISRWKEPILKALISLLKPKGIFERSEVASRRIEGDGGASGLLYGEVPVPVEFKENDFRFLVDIPGGQKTGFFLDQRDKRKAVQKFAEGKNVANCFSFSGGFSVYALAAGAKHTASVDVSQSALDLAKENIKLNNLPLDRASFVNKDVKLFLKEMNKNEYDMIILDPPAFIKDRKKVRQGIAGYRKINEMAMERIPKEGILVSCSCSAHLPMQQFRYLLTECGGRTGRWLQLLESFTHGADHPELCAFNEGEYLKTLFFRVL